MAEDKTCAIEVYGLHKKFKENEVLKGLDLTVPAGKVFALLGQNGAGKTTIVRILSTLLGYDSGKVKVFSHDLSKEGSAVRKKISLTGQYVALDEDLTGKQNLVLIAKLLGYNGQQAIRRANELLDMFDLSEVANRLTKTYSGGMHRRLDIAASIIKAPELLFLDEPTTGLDPRSRSVVWDFIRGLAKTGTTVFLTTQYLEEADQLADLIAVVNDGRIVALGSPRELKNLVGRKAIKIRFQDNEECEKAEALMGKVFHGQRIAKKEDDLLTIEISEILQANALLKELADADIEPVEYTIAQASLDEVFITLTGGKTNE